MAQFVTSTYPEVGPQERIVKTTPAKSRIVFPPDEATSAPRDNAITPPENGKDTEPM